MHHRSGVDTLNVRGAADIAGVVSGASLQNIADSGGEFDATSQFLSSYGPASNVSVQSISGEIIANSLSFSVALVDNANQIVNGPDNAAYPGINRYPGNFEAVALHGDVSVADSLRLAPSESGTLNLLAGHSLVAYSTGQSGGSQAVSTGPSLVEQTFDPVNPLAEFGPALGSQSFDLGAHLLHFDDAIPNRFYAATGNIISGSGGSAAIFDQRPLTWEINKPAKVRASEDIIDLSFFGQNLNPADVTEIRAGHDLLYTGAWQELLLFGGTPNLAEPQNVGGLSLAGPGFFDVEAGHNLGPFVTAQGDIIAGTVGSTPDSIGTGIVAFGNTVVVGNRQMLSDHNPNVADSFAAGANEKLPRQGADVVALFGVGQGIDYDAVEKTYIDGNQTPFAWLTAGGDVPRNDVIAQFINPITATGPRSYGLALQNFVRSQGRPAETVDEAWTQFQSLSQRDQNSFIVQVYNNELRIPIAYTTFLQNLGADGQFKYLASPELQHIFLDKLFLDESRVTGDSAGCCFKDYGNSPGSRAA